MRAAQVRLVKINIDENQELAQQMRIQSIPAVYAFKDGRPVDGFVGALPESQVKQFVARLAGAAAGPDPVAEAVALAKEAARRRRPCPRGQHLSPRCSSTIPANVDALAGLARAAVARKDSAKAKQFLDRVPKEQAAHAEIAAARAALELAETGGKAAGAAGRAEGPARARPQGPPGAL